MERFNQKVEINLLKALAKFRTYADNNITEEEAINKNDLCFIDHANICLIQANSEQAKRILYKFVNKDNNLKTPELDYTDLKIGLGSNYNVYYFKSIIELFKASGVEHINILSKKDFPITFENKHFKVILAPEID